MLNSAKDLAVSRIPFWFVCSVCAILIICRLWFQLVASPIPDEAYYWLWGQHLDWSYYDHPPLQAWVQRLTYEIFGASRFALRLPTFLCSIVLIFVILRLCKLTKLELSPLARFVVVVGVFCSPLYREYTAIVFNDYVMITAASLAGLLAYEEALWLRSPNAKPNTKRVLAIGLFLGLAGLAKYNALFFAIGLMAFIAYDRPCRKLFASPSFYFAIVIGLICIFPIIWWNLSNGAQSFDYNLNKRFASAEGISALIGRIALFLIPFFIYTSIFIWGGLFNRNPKNETTDVLHRISLFTFTTSTLGFIILSYNTVVQIYWNSPAIILALPYMIIVLRNRGLLIAHMLLGLLFAIAAPIHNTITPAPTLTERDRQESAIFYGWQEITPIVTEHVKIQSPDFIVTTDYRSGSILAFWLNNKNIEVIAKRISQFTLWFDHEERDGQTALLLASDWFPLTEFHKQYFSQITEIDRIEIKRFGRPLTTYYLYSAKDYRNNS